jgi:hypothetical protein
MNDDEILELERKTWAEELRFFSNRGKEERERWVVAKFLTRLGVSFSRSDVMSCDPHSKVDVRFQGACFQVKEMPTPGVRRGAEVKALWKQAQAANRPDEVVGEPMAHDVPPPDRAYRLVTEKAKELAHSGQYDPSALDLLIYVTRTHAAPIKPEEVNLRALGTIGWRSVSYLLGDEALVLFVGEDAPAFLRAGTTGS